MRNNDQYEYGHVAVADAKTAAIRAWVAAMAAEGAGVPTVENAFGVLRQVLGAAVENRRIPRNLAYVEAHSEPRRKSKHHPTSHEPPSAPSSP